MSDPLLVSLGLLQVPYIPQLFYLKKKGLLVLLLSKIMDDFLVTGRKAEVDSFLTKFDARFKFGTVVHGPGHVRSFGLNILQDEYYTILVHADDKLDSIEGPIISRIRRGQTTVITP